MITRDLSTHKEKKTTNTDFNFCGNCGRTGRCKMYDKYARPRGKSTPSRVLFAGPPGSANQIDQRRLSLLPSTGLETAVWVDEQQGIREEPEHVSHTVLDLLASRNTGGVDIVNPRTNLVRVSVVLERLEQLHVTLRRLDRDDIGVQALDGWENVIKIRIAEVRMGLGRISHTSSGETEGINSPGEIFLPVGTTEGQLKVNYGQSIVTGKADPRTPSRMAGSST